MIMAAHLRKLALTAHVSSSVGWLGAVAAFSVLAAAGLTSQDQALLRGSYLAMDVTGWYVIVPLSLASMLSGLVMSLGTEWGLFRHYWVLAKFLITLPATVLLLVHMQPVGHLARVVTETTLAHGEFAGLRIQIVAEAAAAVLALLVATGLSVYKPWGMTTSGRRRQRAPGFASGRASLASARRWKRVLLIVVIGLAGLFVLLHLVGRGLGGH